MFLGEVWGQDIKATAELRKHHVVRVTWAKRPESLGTTPHLLLLHLPPTGMMDSGWGGDCGDGGIWGTDLQKRAEQEEGGGQGGCSMVGQVPLCA